MQIKVPPHCSQHRFHGAFYPGPPPPLECRMLSEAVGNVIVYGVSHSGTSITARMLGELGWRMDRADRTYAEDTIIRDLNEAVVARQKASVLSGKDPFAALLDTPLPDGHEEKMRGAISSLAEPWCVKDPRFPHTARHWWPIVGDSALLLWIRRPADDIEASFSRRSQPARRGGFTGVRAMVDVAEREFHWWPGRKASLEYEDVAAAARLFDPNRGKRGPRPGEPMPR